MGSMYFVSKREQPVYDRKGGKKFFARPVCCKVFLHALPTPRSRQTVRIAFGVV